MIESPYLIPQLHSQITQMEGNEIIGPERMKWNGLMIKNKLIINYSNQLS